MPKLRSRAFQSEADLEILREFLRELWRREGPGVPMTTMDVEWWFRQHEGFDPAERIRFWFDDRGALIGYGWFSPPRDLDILVHPELRRAEILEEIVQWGVTQRLHRLERTGTSALPLAVWALDTEIALARSLGRLGFDLDETRCYEHRIRSLDVIPMEEVPRVSVSPEPAGGSAGRLASAAPGPPSPRPLALHTPGGRASGRYTLRSVRGNEDLERRVELHRNAFAPSRVTVESYKAVRASPLYRPDLDLVVETEEESFAAFALGWFDPELALGEFEPVGTHSHHRRRGLSRAVMLEGMRRLKALGARSVIAHVEGGRDPVRSLPAQSLYTALGFEVAARSYRFVREA